MRAALAVVVVIAVVGVAGAQAPIVNARIERRAVAAGLAEAIQATVDRGTTAWVGYAVPLLRPTGGTLRSSEWCCGRCRLEPPTQLLVLVRTEGRTLVELRSQSVDCDLDAGGMPVVWLEEVSPEESIAWLSSLIRNQPAVPRDRLTDAAITALARHASPGAAGPLARLAQEGASAPLRTRALSALALRPAADALQAIDTAIDTDPDVSVRRQAVGALSRLPEGGGVPRLMDLARAHRDPEIRRQAMLSLGQSRDPRAVAFLTQVLTK